MNQRSIQGTAVLWGSECWWGGVKNHRSVSLCLIFQRSDSGKKLHHSVTDLKSWFPLPRQAAEFFSLKIWVGLFMHQRWNIFPPMSVSALPHLHVCSFHWLSTLSHTPAISERLTTYIYSSPLFLQSSKVQVMNYIVVAWHLNYTAHQRQYSHSLYLA